jgi:hypothetical protein
MTTLIPALFMTFVCSTYILVAPEGLALDVTISQIIGGVFSFFLLIVFLVWKNKQLKSG